MPRLIRFRNPPPKLVVTVDEENTKPPLPPSSPVNIERHQQEIRKQEFWKTMDDVAAIYSPIITKNRYRTYETSSPMSESGSFSTTSTTPTSVLNSFERSAPSSPVYARQSFVDEKRPNLNYVASPVMYNQTCLRCIPEILEEDSVIEPSRRRQGSTDSVSSQELPFDVGTISPLSAGKGSNITNIDATLDGPMVPSYSSVEKVYSRKSSEGRLDDSLGTAFKNSHSLRKCLELAMRTAIEDRDVTEMWDVIKGAQYIGMFDTAKKGFQILDDWRRGEKVEEAIV